MTGCGKPSRFTSTVVANTASGYHIFRINDYSRTLTMATGEYLASLPFTVGGHRWYIRYYPNGRMPSSQDYVLIFLFACDRLTKKVKVQFMARFLDDVKEQPLKLKEVREGVAIGKLIRREDFETSKHLQDDSFAIRFDMVVINEFRVEEGVMVSVPPSDLQQHLSGLLQTQKGADVVFNVGGETFNAHRCVLAARSPVFSASLFGPMKESDVGGVVHIEDMEPWVFKALLDFIYTDLFPTTKATKEVEEGGNNDEGVSPQKAEDGDIYALSQHLLVAADKYNLERLKLLCESKLCEYIDVGTVATILALAEQHHCHGLKNVCLHFLSSRANLKAAMANDDFNHMRRSCPSVMEELFDMLAI